MILIYSIMSFKKDFSEMINVDIVLLNSKYIPNSGCVASHGWACIFKHPVGTHWSVYF